MDFYIQYRGVIYRLEIKLPKEVPNDAVGVDKFLKKGYYELKETFEYDDIMNMRIYL